MKSFALIGSGNVGSALGPMLIHAGLSCTGVYSRNESSGSGLARKLQTDFFNKPTNFPKSDLILLAVPDKSIAETSQLLSDRTENIAHTSGTAGLEVLNVPNPGVFYPLQTFTTGREPVTDNFPLLIEGGNKQTEQELMELAKRCSSMVEVCDSDRRKVIHLAAVIACNFTNHLIGESQSILKEAGIPTDILGPLLKETVDKALSSDAFTVQTGPAIRNDQPTIDSQLEALANKPGLQSIYKLITQAIQDKHQS